MARLDRRLEFDARLRRILGSDNLYYEPPASLKMKYPCIRYSRSRIDTVNANNKVYLGNQRYEIIAIYYDVDSDIPERILHNDEGLVFTSDRHYVADGLHHDVFTTTF
ncbi:MAG: hypothetical protein IJ880_06600 [Bacilli bacterium]|nr:hypothetical protein [Bacilli bacterium]